MANNGTGNTPRWRQHAVTAGIAGIAAVFGLAGALIVSGREHGPTQAPIITNNGSGADPAEGNLASSAGGFGMQTSSFGQAQSSPRVSVRVLPVGAFSAPQSYPAGQQAPAPIVRGNNSQANESLQYNTQPPVYSGNSTSNDPNGSGGPNAQYANTDPNAVDPNAPQSDPGYVDADAQENAGYDALQQADQAPPPLPEYDQPPAPADNYLWTPGYWSYSSGYYWVPGAWVAPPFYGALWTPPWWGWYRGHYFFHRGYWGPHVGYYGGVNYGFGYIGTGYYGGYWRDRNFFYNRAVTNVNVNIVRNVYQRTVVVNNVVYNGRPLNRTSFNGPNGIQARPRPYEMAAMREAHYAPLQAQVQMRQAAATNRAQFFSANRGRPAEAFHPAPLSSPQNISSTPPRGINRTDANSFGNSSGIRQPVAAPGGAAGNPRNEMIQQRGGVWQNQPARDGQQRQALEQQRMQQLQQDGQRAQQLQQQQQQRQAFEQQRNQQLQQDQLRNGQFQQQQGQRQALEQQRVQQLQQEGQRTQQLQQQRQALEQQRNSQLQQDQQQRLQQQQQQRQAWEQQRNSQLQQDQQQRLQQQQQQRQAFEQQRNQQLQQDGQQRQALEQQRAQQFQQEQGQRLQVQQQQRQIQEQQRNQQFQQEQQQRAQQQQQQRQAWEQQRNAQQSAAPQHIEARPAAPQNIQARPMPQQHMEAPRPAPPQHFGGGGRH